MIFFGVPVGWSLLVACILYFALTRWKVVYFAADKLVYSLDSFSLLSVPSVSYTHLYDNKEYYLFHCNDKFEVIADYLFDSIEECKDMASKCKKDIVWVKNH